ncbi:tetraacyldisaccharide 4'-kinase [Chitiniphilus eburneus]|uniref:Tetraacyldisaccharide 4'-kinase n=1 Tax=Chitiniphilus eburneus TaxID=2571148 RepID=A0A4U0Q5T6_9NEIS|nr:tetraacyldisaccharide 4'-kinase [Chitiniphilus eburneus]TJZ75542.1 tetraacyldisaccharide 4'-kinase [Chitiniphilus eburneus]
MSFPDRLWYTPHHPLSLLLRPLSWLFGAVAARRRARYLRGTVARVRLPVPVVVIGNISVGGTGKTPLTIWLARALAARGWRPGIVSRGYGGAAVAPQAVSPDSNPALVGDEPLLLARATGVPVFVCRHRAEAGRALLAAYPEVNVILCDDGLQHLALARDLELCVIDGARGVGNGALLPAGPLREPVSRLAEMDALVVNGETALALPAGVPAFAMQLIPGHFHRLDDPGRTRTATDFITPPSAVCGIGNPARFFTTLTALGLVFQPRPFADHHPFTLVDLPLGEVVVTAKDAVKLAALPGLGDAGARIWVLPVAAELSPDLAAWVTQQLESREKPHGPQTA